MTVYLDNQATTRVDPRVIETIVTCMAIDYGNAGSTSHALGWEAKARVDQSRETLAAAVGGDPSEIVFTSGATEANNLAIRGTLTHPRLRRQEERPHVIAAATEHKATLDPLRRLAREGCEVTTLVPAHADGRLEVSQLEAAIQNNTVLFCLMWANNEIGTLQSMESLGACCRQHGVLFFSDATQALGRVPIDLPRVHVDLASFSAHKLYGPKGVGALYVRRGTPRVRIAPLMDGGGQEFGLRSGTLNVPGIAGFAKAVELSLLEQETEVGRLANLRNQLFSRLQAGLPDVRLNGPTLDPPERRLAGNLNLHFPGTDGEALMLKMPEIAVSSGSACTSADPEPSHVLQAIGLTADEARCCLRISLGRFNTEADVELAARRIVDSVHELRRLGS
ncbi:MAG: cysteine desulfurase family protein [Planctomycetota bacterium]